MTQIWPLAGVGVSGRAPVDYEPHFQGHKQ